MPISETPSNALRNGVAQEGERLAQGRESPATPCCRRARRPCGRRRRPFGQRNREERGHRDGEGERVYHEAERQLCQREQGAGNAGADEVARLQRELVEAVRGLQLFLWHEEWHHGGRSWVEEPTADAQQRRQRDE
ncbi:MAG TPA: hypothetical protein VKC57_10905 [Ktedonobacterales bacterium]|nr:hypothetical protein [Ktedonobacterales bacterium]